MHAPGQPPARPARPGWVVAALVGLTALALLLRAAAAHGGLWRDEGLFLFVVGLPSWGGMLRFLREHESHPPLYYLLARLWTGAFGAGDGAAGILPLALGGALVPAIYRVGAGLFTWRAGLVAAVLAALSPSLVEHGAVVRPYAFLPLLSLAAVYALIGGVERGGRRRWVVYALAMLALLYTHNWTWMLLGAHWAAVAVVFARGTNRPRRAVAREWLAAQGAVAAGYLAWLPTFLHQARYAGHGVNMRLSEVHDAASALGAVPYVAAKLLNGTVLPPGPDQLPAAVALAALAVLALPVLVVVARYAVAGAARVPRGAAVTVLCVVPPAAITAAALLSVRSDLIIARCLVVLTPLMLVAVAHGAERLAARGRRAALAAGVAVAIVVATYGPGLADAARRPRSNARELARAVAARTRPTDLVVIVPEWMAASFNRYYAPSVEQIDYPHFGREGATSFNRVLARLNDPATFARAETRLAAARAAGRRIWLVMERGNWVGSEAEAASLVAGNPEFGTVGTARAYQLRGRLHALYGPPDSVAVPREPGARYETLDAYLFAPPPAPR